MGLKKGDIVRHKRPEPHTSGSYIITHEAGQDPKYGWRRFIIYNPLDGSRMALECCLERDYAPAETEARRYTIPANLFRNENGVYYSSNKFVNNLPE